MKHLLFNIIYAIKKIFFSLIYWKKVERYDRIEFIVELHFTMEDIYERRNRKIYK